MKTRLFSSNHEILDSKTVMLFDKDSELSIKIDTEQKFEFAVTFRFADDISGESKIQKEIQNNEITFICINFNNILGTSTSIPMELATVSGKKMYMHLYVSRMEDGIRKITYTIFVQVKGE